MKNQLILMIGLLAFIVFVLGCTQQSKGYTAPTFSSIDDCTEINESGDYKITKNIFGNISKNQSHLECLKITANNVYIDGDGHTILGMGWGSGISISGSNNSVMNMTIDNYQTGISIENSQGNTVSGIIIKSKNLGILLFSSSNNRISNVLTHDNMINGVGLTMSNNNILTNITSNFNGFDGIHLSESSNNTITNSKFCNNKQNDINLFNSNNNLGNNTCDKITIFVGKNQIFCMDTC